MTLKIPNTKLQVSHFVLAYAVLVTEFLSRPRFVFHFFILFHFSHDDNDDSGGDDGPPQSNP